MRLYLLTLESEENFYLFQIVHLGVYITKSS